MVKVLVQFYNPMIKHNYFPSRWSVVLDVIIEKGKDRKKKLRVLQISDTYLQLSMRIFLRLRIEKNCENDKKLSNHNYGYRKCHSIESVLLEKRLIFDLAKKRGIFTCYI